MQPEIKQGTIEWKLQRLGKVTASRVAEVVAKTKTGWSTSRANYAAELICERLTGVPQEGYTNATMQWGTDNEPRARNAYEFFSNVSVVEAPFVQHPTIKMSGASPDGFVNADGLLEIKCPNTATHLDTFLSEAIDKKYMTQMAWQMACTGRKWCDFVSFDPRLPLELQLKIIRVNSDDVFIQSLEKEVSEFISEIEIKIKELEKYKSKEAAA